MWILGRTYQLLSKDQLEGWQSIEYPHCYGVPEGGREGGKEEGERAGGREGGRVSTMAGSEQLVHCLTSCRRNTPFPVS